MSEQNQHVAPEAQGLGAGLVLLTVEQRAELRQLAEAAKADEPGRWHSSHVVGPLAISQADASYLAFLQPDLTLGTLTYIEQLEARLATLEAAGAGRNWVADGLPPAEDADGVSAYVLVWSEPHEMPQVRYYDHGGEHWAGGNGTWESTRRFEQWAPIPPFTPVAPAPVAPAPEQPAQEGGSRG